MLRNLLFLIILLLACPCSFAATEFVSAINIDASEDYGTLTLWEGAMDDAGDLTIPSTGVLGHDGIIGTISDGDTLTGLTSNVTGITVHTSATQACMYDMGTLGGVFVSGERLYVDANNYVTANTVTDSVVMVAECYDDDGELNEDVDIDGLVTDATNYWKVTAPVGERHDGKQFGNGARVRGSNEFDHAVELKDGFTLWEWVAVKYDDTGTRDAIGVRTGSDGSTVRYSIVTNPAGDHGIELSPAAAVYIYDNIVYNVADNGISVVSFSSPATEIYNNTVYNCGADNIVFSDSTNNGVVKNNLALTTGGSCYSVGNATVLTNGSSDATGTSTPIDLTNLVADDELITPGTDHHIETTATSRNRGTNLAAPSGVEIDIDGYDRSDYGFTWDIGADEIDHSLSGDDTYQIGTGITRDYSTITLWEADLDNTNIYSANDDAVGECYDDSAFDEVFTINGGTTVGLTSATLTVASGERHDGTAGNGARIVRTGAGDIITISGTEAGSPEYNIRWLEINANSQQVANMYHGGQVSSPYLEVTNVIAHNSELSNNTIQGIRPLSTKIRIMNCIVYDVKYTGGSSYDAVGIGYTASLRAQEVYNCTVYNVYANLDHASTFVYGIGVKDAAGQVVKNCISMDTSCASEVNATIRDYNLPTPSNATMSYNLSSDATASGTGSLVNKSSAIQFISTTGGSEDLHLLFNADARKRGTDLGTTPTGVEIDIDGRDRDANNDTWDIGADQFIGRRRILITTS